MKTLKLGVYIHLLFLSLSFDFFAQTTFSTPGTYTWTVPPCVTEITVHTYGGGGGGGGALAILRTASESMEACSGSGGGGGGGYSSNTYTVVPGQTYTIVVGAGGIAGTAGAGSWNNGITTPAGNGGTGGTSSFSGNGYNLQATGGTGGNGASGYNNNNTNDVNNTGNGGAGGNGSGGAVNGVGGIGSGGYHGNFGIDKSGAGGGAAGPGGNGANSVQNANVGNNQGGTGQGPGGNGANGVFHNTPNNGGSAGTAGVAYGGGGGGAVAHRGSSYGVQSYVGGVGGNGAVLIEYETGNLPLAPVTQNFVSCNQGTVADLVATGNAIQWYATASGGTPLDPTTPLISGQTYYATQTVDGCESARTAATVTIHATPSPILNPMQICDNSSLTLNDIQITGANISWFSDAGMTTLLLGETPVVFGQSYYAIQSSNGCDSEPVLVVINPTITPPPTSLSIHEFCLHEQATLNDLPIDGINIQWYSQNMGGNLLPLTTLLVHNQVYYASQTVDGCESDRILITVHLLEGIVPTFVNPGPLCQGTNYVFPTVSQNGINGTWTPSFNNQQTETYVFTPINQNECDQLATMTIVIESAVQPTFTPVGPLCEGQTFVLPTHSLEGITGTWTPTENPTQTTMYLFTPALVGCASPVNLTVSITQNQLPIFDELTPICSGELLVLPTTSTNGIDGSWSPNVNNTATTTYTFTPLATTCASEINTTVIVQDPIVPLFDPIGPFCVGDNIVLPITSLNGIDGTWTPQINNQQTTTYTFVPIGGECAVEAILSIVISDEITPSFTQLDPVCIGTDFILPSTSLEGIAGTWSPAINNTVTTLYTFTPAFLGCYNNATMLVQVEPAELPLFDELGPFCEGTTFTLPTTSLNGYYGTWTPAVNTQQTTNYTFTMGGHSCPVPGAMEVVILPEVTPTFQQMGPFCAGEVFALPSVSENGILGSWSPAVNNQQTTNYTFSANTGTCVETTAMTIEIGNAIAISVSDGFSLCESDSVPEIVVTFSGGNAPYTCYVSIDDFPVSSFQSSTNTLSISPFDLIGFGVDEAGCFDLTISLGGSANCGIETLNLTEYICVFDSPNAHFSATQPDFLGTVYFTNLSTNATHYSWDFGADLSTSEMNPSHTFSENGNFSVVLYAFNATGCVDSIIQVVSFSEALLFYVPNAFTPDGDEFNHVFKPILTSGIDLFSYQMDIFDRWGELIFTTQNTEVGWDGTYNDKEVQEGVYTWKIHFKLKDKDDRQEHVGHVNKLR